MSQTDEIIIPDRAQAYVERAESKAEHGDYAGATSLFRRAALAAPLWSLPQRRLGLLAKRQGRWEEALQHSSFALDLDPEDIQALWNLGLAATALGRWDDARYSWSAFGIEGLAKEGEPRYPMPLRTKIRLEAGDDDQYVWCNRIDPVRFLITDIPGEGCGYRYNDILLLDRAADLTTVAKHVDLEVLKLLEVSPYSTFTVTVAGVDDAWLEAVDVAELENGAVQCWAISMHMSETVEDDGADCEVTLAIAALDEDAAWSILQEWTAMDGVAITSPLQCVLDASVAAQRRSR